MNKGMKKATLLYASPFPPCKSGIADYSEILVYGLQQFFDITLLIDQYTLSNARLYKDFKVISYGKQDIDFDDYDYRIYNVGNSSTFHSYLYDIALNYPGMVILHDFVINQLIIGHYYKKDRLYSKIYEIAGARGIYHIKEQAERGEELLYCCARLANVLPLNEELIHSGNKIMVHSQYSYERVSRIIADQKQLRKINLVDQIQRDEQFISKRSLFQKYSIPESDFLICSFGYIEPPKLNHVICKTVQQLNKRLDNQLVYLMVGQGIYIDEYLSDTIKKTGFVDLAEFNSLIRWADIVVNLRYPSMGETSAALIRALGLGKPCIVSNDAWFSELPDDVVVKIENNHVEAELSQRLIELITSPDVRKRLSKKAQCYIKEEHNITRISQEIVEFLQ